MICPVGKAGITPLLVLVFVLACLLGGCTHTGSTQSLAPVCEALGAPIEYNSRNKNSDYHAGPKLAPRLATQNRVGTGLNCTGY